MKKYFLSLALLGAIQVKAKTKDLWVYFDLGNTVINVKDKNNFDYFSGSKTYISRLKSLGYKIGVISNIPESFGQTHEEKLETLKNYISSKWSGSESFDWEVFDKIYLPLSNSELKPAPVLYKRAIVENQLKKAVFISETEKEVIAAQELGFAGHVFDDQSHQLYIPIEELEEYIEVNSQIGDISIL